MWVACLLFLFLACFSKKFFEFARRLVKLRKFKTVPGKFLIGHVDLFKEPNKLPFTLSTLHQTHGPVFRLNLGPIFFLIVADPHYAEVLLSNSKIVDKSLFQPFTKSWFGDGVSVSSDEELLSLKKTYSSAFRLQRLKNFVDAYNSGGRVLVDRLGETMGKSFDFLGVVDDIVMDIVMEAALGTKVSFDSSNTFNYGSAIRSLKNIVIKRVLSPIHHPDFIFALTEGYREEVKLTSAINDLTRAIIRERRLKNGSGTFMDAMFETTLYGKPLTDEQINYEINVVLFAGFDTVATAAALFLYQMSLHQDIQEKVVQELKTVFGDKQNSTVDYEELQKLKYLEMSIKEAIRIMPPVAMMFRHTLKDVVVDGKTIPKGTVIMINTYAMHSDPQLFPKPEEFVPERFSPENDGGHNHAFLGFSKGPRKCPGWQFALFELKILLSHVLRNFKVLPVPERKLDLIHDMTITSTSGVWLRFEERAF